MNYLLLIGSVMVMWIGVIISPPTTPPLPANVERGSYNNIK